MDVDDLVGTIEEIAGAISGVALGGIGGFVPLLRIAQAIYAKEGRDDVQLSVAQLRALKRMIKQYPNEFELVRVTRNMGPIKKGTYVRVR